MTVTFIERETHGCGRWALCHVYVPEFLVDTGQAHWADKDIDLCLATLVNELNRMGALTAACCCGHGIAPGGIVLHDGTHINLGVCQDGNGIAPPVLLKRGE